MCHVSCCQNYNYNSLGKGGRTRNVPQSKHKFRVMLVFLLNDWSLKPVEKMVPGKTYYRKVSCCSRGECLSPLLFLKYILLPSAPHLRSGIKLATVIFSWDLTSWNSFLFSVPIEDLHVLRCSWSVLLVMWLPFKITALWLWWQQQDFPLISGDVKGIF